MQKQILQEVKELKIAIAKVIGADLLLPEEPFSEEALNKAAKEFQKLSIERGEWVDDCHIKKYIKSAPYAGAGAFIKQEFFFTNYFKKGKSFFYNKKNLISLGNELKERNVDLSRYMELKADQAKFIKYVANANANSNGKKKNKNYLLSDDLRDITTSPAKKPSPEIILEDLKKLREEFLQYNLSDYVDVYRNTHAMMKFIYHFEKYINPDIKKRCRKWCDNFNYANDALQKVTNEKVNFIPIKEDDMIQL
jgi:hypothetical protein